ncbi:HipA domain-containing protein [Cupriavidus basilensis]|uniref:HipA domain-containing protein n=1 Tax=Cupriavidus basilensis TaxID=68895 RepID=A0ABT6AVS2_9BURK|nr:HipA domain-containing protein [Cupriavidus basilensis]MDF3836722.1 HipA domain-containing protein [Cupriavidus basilensis]
MTKRSLVASINGIPVGELDAADDIWQFVYDPAWLASPERYALGPELPLQPEPIRDGSTKRHVQWYFDNLLPEEGQRTLLAADAKVSAGDSFALLEYYGAESAGSVTLLRPGQANHLTPALRQLSLEALEARIQNLPHVPLTHSAIKRMSLAGAQHKLAVVFRDGALFEPGGPTPSTHILKPNHQDTDDYPHSVINEYFVLRLADALRLPVPGVRRLYVPSPVYLIDRFDRIEVTGEWKRVHTLDACQLLSMSSAFKYSRGSVDTLCDLVDRTRFPASTRINLFRWLVFNLLIGNSDAHLKNLSFLVTTEGISLAPFYDLLSVAAYDTGTYGKSGWPAATRLAWGLLGTDAFHAVDKALLISGAEKLGISARTAERFLHQMCKDILPAADNLLTEIRTGNAKLRTANPALAPVLAGEEKMLRVIRFTIIADMVKQLS